jgi:hypothetical protein
MLESSGQNEEQIENLSQFKNFGSTVTNQNLIHDKIKRRLNSGNVCYHSVLSLLSSRLLKKIIKIRIYKIIIFPLLLCGSEILFVTLQDNIHWGCLRTGC